VATHDAEAGRTAVFLVNRSQTEDATVTIDVAALGDITVLDAQTLNDDADVYAANTLLERERVSLRDNKSVVAGAGMVTVTLPPVSWSAISLGQAS
jgi:alpha-N-arabinofuranosidase